MGSCRDGGAAAGAGDPNGEKVVDGEGMLLSLQTPSFRFQCRRKLYQHYSHIKRTQPAYADGVSNLHKYAIK